MFEREEEPLQYRLLVNSSIEYLYTTRVNNYQPNITKANADIKQAVKVSKPLQSYIFSYKLFRISLANGLKIQPCKQMFAF